MCCGDLGRAKVIQYSRKGKVVSIQGKAWQSREPALVDIMKLVYCNGRLFTSGKISISPANCRIPEKRDLVRILIPVSLNI